MLMISGFVFDQILIPRVARSVDMGMFMIDVCRSLYSGGIMYAVVVGVIVVKIYSPRRNIE